MNDVNEMHEPSRLKTSLWVLLYSLVCGALLSVFSIVTELGLFRYVFSLAALFLGIRFFRNYDKISTRVIFIVLSIVFYFMTTIIATVILIANGQIELPAE
ncbi:hypothetical protein [Paenibacillus abyssi]|uniref:Uncharacterized protein n=1 Tax=Paenibacillus abyssi TaxID=1340531 RepID=A0A917FXX4_9BACL|nr:hypothetical protein [Paenibacillus abyssi]GGG12871.1 hypothetical protein GCM10010916_32240 [Paenibacillus abyssi]